MKNTFLPNSAVNFYDQDLLNIDFIFRKVCVPDESGLSLSVREFAHYNKIDTVLDKGQNKPGEIYWKIVWQS